MEHKLHFSFKQTQKMYRIISRIDQFNGSWLATEKNNPPSLCHLKKMASFRSIGSSLRIEGFNIDNDSVQSIVENIKANEVNLEFQPLVVGYYDVLQYLSNNYNNIVLSENNILQIYNLLYEPSINNLYHKSIIIKKQTLTQNQQPTLGTHGITNPLPPPFIRREINRLLTLTKNAFHENYIHPLLVITLFFHEFLSRNPFFEGNGLMCRILTTLLFLQKGYTFIQCSSLEQSIEKKEPEYRYFLSQKMKGKENNTFKTLYPWVLFYITCIEDMIENLEREYAVHKYRGQYINDRQKKIIAIVLDNQPLRLNDIHTKLENVSINTIKKDLRHLVTEGIFHKFGKNRGTSYYCI